MRSQIMKNILVVIAGTLRHFFAARNILARTRNLDPTEVSNKKIGFLAALNAGPFAPLHGPRRKVTPVDFLGYAHFFAIPAAFFFWKRVTDKCPPRTGAGE